MASAAQRPRGVRQPRSTGSVRRALNTLYTASGGLAALCLAGTCVVMLLQVAGREARILFRGADDITAWLCAASVFFALGHTFRHGELVRVGLFIERFRPAARWWAEVFSLSVTTGFVGYMVWAVVRFVYASWQFNELAQGLIKIPIWIPQMSFVLGVLVLFIAVADELVTVLRRDKPAYQIAEDERRARGDFTETV